MSGEALATTLTPQQTKKSLKAKKDKKKPIATKSVLCSPYVAKWPPVEASVQKDILAQLKLFFERECPADVKPVGRAGPSHREKTTFVKSGQKSKLRLHLTCGINQTTRFLEQDKLRLVLVDRSSPWLLHEHLAQLSAVRRCPAAAVDNLSATVSPLLQVSQICCLGVKKPSVENNADQDIFIELVDSISALCPIMELPWLECETYLKELKAKHLSEQQQQQSSCDDDTTACSEHDEQHDDDITDRPAAAATVSRKLTDYSHLYLYRQPQQQQTAANADLTASFIQLPQSSDEDNYSDVDGDSFTTVGKRSGAPCAGPVSATAVGVKLGKSGGRKRKSAYLSPNVGIQKANENKKKRKLRD